jgi:hypothetical protein
MTTLNKNNLTLSQKAHALINANKVTVTPSIKSESKINVSVVPIVPGNKNTLIEKLKNLKNNVDSLKRDNIVSVSSTPITLPIRNKLINNNLNVFTQFKANSNNNNIVLNDIKTEEIRNNSEITVTTGSESIKLAATTETTGTATTGATTGTATTGATTTGATGITTTATTATTTGTTGATTTGTTATTTGTTATTTGTTAIEKCSNIVNTVENIIIDSENIVKDAVNNVESVIETIVTDAKDLIFNNVPSIPSSVVLPVETQLPIINCTLQSKTLSTVEQQALSIGLSNPIDLPSNISLTFQEAWPYLIYQVVDTKTGNVLPVGSSTPNVTEGYFFLNAASIKSLASSGIYLCTGIPTANNQTTMYGWMTYNWTPTDLSNYTFILNVWCAVPTQSLVTPLLGTTDPLIGDTTTNRTTNPTRTQRGFPLGGRGGIVRRV